MIHLFSKNYNCAIFNKEMLEEMEEETKVYKSEYEGGSKNMRCHVLAPKYLLHARVGCLVMLLKYISGKKLVNCMIGTAVELKAKSVMFFF